MNRHRCGATFDYVLYLEGVSPTEFVGWSTECQMRNFDGKLLNVIPSAWVDESAPVAVSLLQLDTTKWKPGSVIVDVLFTDSEGYVRNLENPIQWELIR